MDGELMNEQGARVVQRVQGQKRLNKRKKEQMHDRSWASWVSCFLPCVDLFPLSSSSYISPLLSTCNAPAVVSMSASSERLCRQSSNARAGFSNRGRHRMRVAPPEHTPVRARTTPGPGSDDSFL